ncbi:4-galactosyl-N-acetylglucosaminide 3-alpha-L-fucosyltransferase 9 isoform X6 [Taeniopygia guttata]|uniref:4-galactosyl-N-acetylglucosaminide 3-alpha-L-fucosyltransferase 9 isoform X6 n=1 Tax=Taeniopygia guttata TaxID=59729 RepID=UPI003BB8D793
MEARKDRGLPERAPELPSFSPCAARPRASPGPPLPAPPLRVPAPGADSPRILLRRRRRRQRRGWAARARPGAARAPPLAPAPAPAAAPAPQPPAHRGQRRRRAIRSPRLGRIFTHSAICLMKLLYSRMHHRWKILSPQPQCTGEVTMEMNTPPKAVLRHLLFCSYCGLYDQQQERHWTGPALNESQHEIGPLSIKEHPCGASSAGPQLLQVQRKQSGRNPASEVSLTIFCLPVKFYQRMKEILSATFSFDFYSQNGLQPEVAHPRVLFFR